MRLLVDENLGRSVLEGLEALGHDVASVPQSGPPLPDNEVFSAAAADGRTLLTLDEGFTSPLRFDPSDTGGIVVLSLPDEPSLELGAPTERVLGQKMDALRAAADLWRDVERLEDEERETATTDARLRRSLADALENGQATDARELEKDLESARSRAMTLAARREVRQVEARRAERLAEELEVRYRDLVFNHAMARSQTLIQSVAADLPEEAETPPPADRPTGDKVAVAASVDSPPMLDHDERYATDARYRATWNEARLRAGLARVWGSLASELARALALLISAAETRDPAGKLWLAGVDGVRALRDDTGAGRQAGSDAVNVAPKSQD